MAKQHDSVIDELYTNQKSDFEQMMNIAFYEGKIIEVFKSADNCTVEITTSDTESKGPQQIQNVPIHYHCENTTTIRGGSSPFAIDDKVIVMNRTGVLNPTADDLVVIGFVGEIRACKPLVLIKAGEYASLYSMQLEDVFQNMRNPMFDEVDAQGNKVHPNTPEFFVFPERIRDGDPFALYIADHLEDERTGDKPQSLNLWESIWTDRGTFRDNSGNLISPDYIENESDMPNINRFDGSSGLCGYGWGFNFYIATVNGPKYQQRVQDVTWKYSSSVGGQFTNWVQAYRPENDKIWGAWDVSMRRVNTYQDFDSGTQARTRAKFCQIPVQWCSDPACAELAACVRNSIGFVTSSLSCAVNSRSTTKTEYTVNCVCPLGPLVTDESWTSGHREWTQVGSYYEECALNSVYTPGCSTDGRCAVYTFLKKQNGTTSRKNTTTYLPCETHIKGALEEKIATFHRVGQAVLQVYALSRRRYTGLEANDSTFIHEEIHIKAMAESFAVPIWDELNERLNYSNYSQGRSTPSFEYAVRQVCEMARSSRGYANGYLDAFFVRRK